MAKSFIKMGCTEPVLVSTSSVSSCSAWPKSPPGQWPRRFRLLWAYHKAVCFPSMCSHLWTDCITSYLWCSCSRCQIPVELSEWFPFWYRQAVGKIWFQCRCSIRSVIPRQMKIRRTLTTLTHSKPDCQQREKIHACVWRFPTLFSPEDTSRAWFVSAEKKIKYFLNRPRTLFPQIEKCAWVSVCIFYAISEKKNVVTFLLNFYSCLHHPERKISLTILY